MENSWIYYGSIPYSSNSKESNIMIFFLKQIYWSLNWFSNCILFFILLQQSLNFSPVWTCHKCVPASEALNLYWKVVNVGMAHWVTMDTPSMNGVPCCGCPLQCTAAPEPDTLFTTSTTSMSFWQTWRKMYSKT